MVLHPEAGTAPPGYYFVGNVFKANGEAGIGEGGYAMILDLNGTPVWYSKTINNGGAKDPDFVDENTIVFVPIGGYTFADYNGAFELHHLNPVSVTYVATVGQPLDTHEFRVLPNGDYLMFSDQITVGVDLTGLGGATGPWGPNSDTLDCIIQEVTPGGELVWQWRGSDHFDIVQEGTYVVGEGARWPDGGANVNVADPFHCNSIDWDQDGNLLVSARDMDAVFLVSNPGTTDGHVIWKMGGTTYNKDNATHITVINDTGNGFYRQHHVRYVDGGTITIFDDRTSVPGPTRGMQVAVDVDAGTASIVWQYGFPTHATSIGMGSVTILSDGSHVVGWGYPPNGNPLAFTESDPAGNDLADFYFPNNPESSYRALKYPASVLNLETLRKSVGYWSSVNGGIPDGGSLTVIDSGADGGVDAATADGGVDAATADGSHD